MCTDCKEKDVVTPVVLQVNSGDVYFGDGCDPNDKLSNLDIKAGADLTKVLKKIDYKFGDSFNTVNFKSFNLLYLAGKYSVNTIKTFSEGISTELSLLNSKAASLLITVNSSLVSSGLLTSKVEAIRIPNITDTSSIGFTVNDNINTVLQKITNKFNTLNSSTSTNLSSLDSNSIRFNLSNTSTINASVKISDYPNNKVQIYSDGIYVAPFVNTNQTLNIVGNQLSITGGNAVTIPVSGLQTLSLSGNNLTISGQNSVTLPTFTETNLNTADSTTVRFTTTGSTNHNVTANIRVSSVTGNILTVNSDGVYVSLNAGNLLNQISNDVTLKNTLCNIISNCSINICYKWFIQNLSVSTASVSYIDVNNISQILTVASNSFQSVSGSKILTNPTSTLIITFQGKC